MGILGSRIKGGFMFNAQKMKWFILPLCLMLVTGLAQQTVQLPEPDLSAFPVPIVKVSLKEIANYPIDASLTDFKSLKQHIDTTVLLVGKHMFFANDKTVYRLTNRIKRTLTFNSPLFKVITDWKSRVFVMTKNRWVYIFELNSLKQLSSFQVKYDQNMSNLTYLSGDILMVGFDLWKDEAKKNRNPVAAVGYGLNGIERWKIDNTAKIFSESDERTSFEVLQVGTRSFIANCCNRSVQIISYEAGLKTAFLYENPTGKLRISDIDVGDNISPAPTYINIDNPNLFTHHDFTNIDMFNYQKFPNVAFKRLIDDTKLGLVFPKCDFFAQENRRLIYKKYFVFSLYNHCGGKVSFLDTISKSVLKFTNSENCMYQSEDSNRGNYNRDITSVKTKDYEFFLDPYTFSTAKMGEPNQIETKCIYKFSKDLVNSSSWNNVRTFVYKYSDNSVLLHIINDVKEISIGFSEDSNQALLYEKKLSVLNSNFAISLTGKNLFYYEVRR